MDDVERLDVHSGPTRDTPPVNIHFRYVDCNDRANLVQRLKQQVQLEKLLTRLLREKYPAVPLSSGTTPRNDKSTHRTQDLLLCPLTKKPYSALTFSGLYRVSS